ncbi:MAG: ATP-binding protein [Thermodesulfobacteriota bacterium]
MPSPTPARTLTAAYQQLRFDQALASDDPRFVDTSAARGDFNRQKMIRALMAWRGEGAGQGGSYFLYTGHVGCGKSTELRRLARELHRPDGFSVIMLDTLQRLDPHNLSYPDVLFALAAELLAVLERDGWQVDPIFLHNLETWFAERVEKHDQTRELAAEIRTGAEGRTGIPFLGHVFARLTTSFKVNSTYKQELRTVVKNSFADFARAFNQLIVAADSAIGQIDSGRRVLFIVDGTDRLSREDGKAFFIEDIHQLQLIDSVFVYCAPISLVFDQRSFLPNIYTDLFHLPMIKLSEKTDLADAQPSPAGYEAMRRLILARVERALFDDDATLDYLIRYSGGNPRHLLRLLSYSYTEAEGERFDRRAAEKAVQRYATDYRYQLAAEDFALLQRVDSLDDPSRLSAQERERVGALLYYGALLEYNSFWWRSHPLVRTLPAYLHAQGSGTP